MCLAAGIHPDPLSDLDPPPSPSARGGGGGLVLKGEGGGRRERGGKGEGRGGEWEKREWLGEWLPPCYLTSGYGLELVDFFT